jgi:phage terminase small subunit
MGRPGRAPKPSALKVIEGVHPFRINLDEPATIPPSLDAPGWLKGLALEHWEELAPILHRVRVFSQADRAALAMLCDDYRRLRTDPDDWKARDRYRRMLIEFGLTPSARSRIRATPEEKADELEAFLGRKTK